MNHLNRFRKKKSFLFIISLIFILSIGAYVTKRAELGDNIRPSYEKIDISPILSKHKRSENDYKTLFYQTGLGKIAIDEILENKETGINEIINFQEDFFSDVHTLCERFGIFTNRESIVDDNGAFKYGFNLAPYSNGYVLITKSTHSLSWRHGHSAIITNSEDNQVLEAVVLGQNSKILDINDWRVYPSFIMLKLKDSSEETLNKIARFAESNMVDVPYKLTVGLFNKKNPSKENLKGTHCSHLIWYAFNQFGYDVDSNGSLLVTPIDILNSDLFEVVQIYGVNPEDFWP